MQLQDVRCFLLDMDGTFYLGGQIIPGSLEFIEKVVSSGRDFMFLTNNSSHNANFYVQKLAKMGLSIDRRRVMTSGEATCEKISELYPGRRAFVLGNEFLREEFREAGIPLDDEHPDIVVNFAAESHVDRSIEDPGVFLQTYIIGTATLMDACR